MITLASKGVSGRSPVARVGLNGFVKFLDFPPAGVLRLHPNAISPLRRTGRVIGHQIKFSLDRISVFEPGRRSGPAGSGVAGKPHLLTRQPVIETLPMPTTQSTDSVSVGGQVGSEPLCDWPSWA